MLSEESIEAFINDMKSEWKRNVSGSPEVKKAKGILEVHRRKIKELFNELEVAEQYEKQLMEQEEQIENQAKPTLMRFYESLDKPEDVTIPLIKEASRSQSWDKVVSLTGEKVKHLDTTKRKDIIHLLWIVLKLRDEYTEREQNQPLQILQNQGRSLLKKLGDSSISWMGLADKEVNIMQEIVQEVENIPPFVRRIVETYLSSHNQIRIIYREVSAQTD